MMMMSSFKYNTLFFVRHMHTVICFCICICLCIYSCSDPVEISEKFKSAQMLSSTN